MFIVNATDFRIAIGMWKVRARPIHLAPDLYSPVFDTRADTFFDKHQRYNTKSEPLYPTHNAAVFAHKSCPRQNPGFSHGFTTELLHATYPALLATNRHQPDPQHSDLLLGFVARRRRRR